MKKYINEYLLANNKINTRRVEHNGQWIFKYHTNIYNNLISIFPETTSLSEKIYRILNDIKSVPLCLECNNIVKFQSFQKGYFKFCSHDCSNHSAKRFTIESKQKNMNTLKNKHNNILSTFYDDSIITDIQYIIDEIDKINFKSISYAHLKNHNILFNSLINNTKFIPLDISTFSNLQIPLRYYCIKHHLTEIPVCPICNQNELTFLNSEVGFTQTCSNTCSYTVSAKSRILTTETKIINNIEGFKILEQYQGKDIAIKLQCDKCDGTFDYLFRNGSYFFILCPLCSPNYNKSAIEYHIKEFLTEYGIEVIHSYKIGKKEFDLYLPAYKIAIEFNGIYWHSEKFKDKKFHLDKTTLCEENGIQLLHFFEHETTTKLNIVKSIILSKLKIYETTIYGRKCTLKTLPYKDVKTFIEQNHIQGGYNTKYNYGLFYEGELVSVMTFNRRNLGNKSQFELIRYCCKQNTNIIGGASKLFKYALRFVNENIITYADKRLSNGNLYNILGFEYKHDSKVNYFYYKGITVYSRMQFQKHKLKDKLDIYDESKTEYENMIDNGYGRIWDCGNKVYEYHI